MQTEQDLEKLVHAYTAPLLRYCTAMLGSEADAQDAVQTTFVKAWLYRIAYRTSLDMLRAAKRAEQRKPPEPVPPDPGISESLREALCTLDPLDRALVLERVLDGMDYAALARIHHRPESYLRTRYHRAKRRLAELLEKEGLRHDT